MTSNKNICLTACINYRSNSKIKNKIKCFKKDSYSRYNMKFYEIWLLSFSVSILVSFGELQVLILKEGSIYLKNLPAFPFLVGLHGLDMDTLITG